MCPPENMNLCGHGAVIRADAGVRPYRCGIRHIHVYGHVAEFGLKYPANVNRNGRGGPLRPPGIHQRLWSRCGIRAGT